MDRMLNCLRHFQRTLYEKTVPIKGEEFALRHKPSQEFVPSLSGNSIVSDTSDFRVCLIDEEASELCEALETGTKEEVLKELCDLLYVAVAVAVLYDLPLMAAFNRVHDNNMAKLENGTIREDGKLEKPKGHPKVSLKDLVDAT